MVRIPTRTKVIGEGTLRPRKESCRAPNHGAAVVGEVGHPKVGFARSVRQEADRLGGDVEQRAKESWRLRLELGFDLRARYEAIASVQLDDEAAIKKIGPRAGRLGRGEDRPRAVTEHKRRPVCM